jgi:hypothetical protein
VSAGRDDADVGNQVGVPNATVYVLRNNDLSDLPALDSGIPIGETRCDRCEDQQLGPVLTGAVTDARGNYVLEGNLPVGVEFLLVVKVGKFRRAVSMTLPAAAACQDTALPEALPSNPTRLPRSRNDGLAAHLPQVAISTGPIDAMECVLEKMGLAHGEFGNPDAVDSAVHLYRGGPPVGTPPGSGARIDAQTPHDAALYSDLGRLQAYDLVIADCEGQQWDNDFEERAAFGDNVREYVNRGGRVFASHLSFSWLHENGAQVYSAGAPIDTGLAAAAGWTTTINTADTGTGRVSVGQPGASSQVGNFAAWMIGEGITTAPDFEFEIIEPRSQALSLGAASEQFVHLDLGRVQQFSFDTPLGAPEEASCGRVAYSGFHVSVGGGLSPFADAEFPGHCSGDLTDQEKVLLYMLFDLGACVGDDPLPPSCVPLTCDAAGARCGFAPDGCGGLLDCGACRPPF